MNPDASSTRQPAITAPVSRSLAVADTARSAAFYRDVLAFAIHQTPDGMEATNGPARLHFDVAGPAPAVVFFETDDVAGLHAAIRDRGGQPSEIAKVNGIKMRMFEVRDPDGHTLWFGQSYHVPDAASPAPLLEKALPELPLDDVAAGIAYYRDVLGFQVNYRQHDLGVMYRDAVTLLLIARTGRHTGIGSAYIYIANAGRLCAELRARGARVQGEPVSQPWGLREFRVLDLEDNELRFGQPFE
jgi:catechol 2,3-dioxygenase-like lactoylglutathione lyase family enzyme